jgi:hypothetical protein
LVDLHKPQVLCQNYQVPKIMLIITGSHRSWVMKEHLAVCWVTAGRNPFYQPYMNPVSAGLKTNQSKETIAKAAHIPVCKQ